MNSLEDTLKDYIEISELQTVLGYKDNRSVKKWCEQHKIRVFKLGLNRYINLNTILQYIDNQLLIFVKGNKSSHSSNLKIVKDEDFNTGEISKPYRTNSEENLKIIHRNYDPKNETISKYLAKYESRNKTNSAQKRKA